MNTTRIWVATAAAVGLIGLAGCSRDETADMSTQVDQVGAEMSAKADAAGERMDQVQADVGQALDDTAITTKVKSRFAESPAVSALAVSVETEQGVVTLSGTVPSETERLSAESIARSVAEVRDVKNELAVKS